MKKSSARRNGFSCRLEGLEARILLAADAAGGGVSSPPSDDPSSNAPSSMTAGLIQDAKGNQFYFDPAPDRVPRSVRAAVSSDEKVALTSLPLLHSNPTARQKIYLDFDGHVTTGTDWNELNQGRSIYSPAFDNDGDANSFSVDELRMIRRIWERVAEDYAPFDLDVTTESPSAADFTAGSRAIRILVTTSVDAKTGHEWFGSASGVAFVGSWRWRTDTPIWIFTNYLDTATGKPIAETVSHEVGHAFGLGHDGVDPGPDYYDGHGSGATSWAPIMGVGYSRQVTQWSQGEYRGASNTEKDLDVIASALNRVNYRVDDHANGFFLATQLAPDATNVTTVDGVISTQEDRDVFVFQAGAGTFRIAIDPVEIGANLDIEATLYDSSGNAIARSGSDLSLSASFEFNVPAGRYYLEVDGVGHAEASDSGYSNYGSLGHYTVTAMIPRHTSPGHDVFTAIAAARQQARWEKKMAQRFS